MSDSARTPKRILVVEDEYLIASSLSLMLQDEGAQVVGPSPSVERALALVETQAIDAAILDVNLNGDRSFPIAAALEARGIPFLFATGYASGDIPEAWESYPCVMKPMPAEAISRLLATI